MRIPQQVSDRVKEAPAHALRAVFAGIGQVLLVADRIRSRAAEANRARSAPEAQPARPVPNGTDAADQARWRSLDKTGNVRLLSEDDFPEDDVVTATAAPAAEEAAAEPHADFVDAAELPADLADTAEQQELLAEPPVEPVAAGPAVPQPSAAEPIPEPLAEEPAPAMPVAETPEPTTAEPTTAEPTTAEPATAEPVVESPSADAPVAAATVLPVPNYDGLTVASLRARLRNLDPPQLRVLIDYEKAHAGRPDVVTMFERRIAKLEGGET